MMRFVASIAILLGILQVPLALRWETSWLLPAAHLLMCLLVTPMAGMAGWAGRPAEARAWGGWVVVSTGAGMLTLHVANWQAGGWSWILPYVSALLWGWVPVVTAAIAGEMGRVRVWRRARGAVRRRHKVDGVLRQIERAQAAGTDQNSAV